MPTEGTGVKTPTTYRRKPMAQVTYRGVSYDTNNRPNQDVKQSNQQPLVYRGIKVEKK